MWAGEGGEPSGGFGHRVVTRHHTRPCQAIQKVPNSYCCAARTQRPSQTPQPHLRSRDRLRRRSRLRLRRRSEWAERERERSSLGSKGRCPTSPSSGSAAALLHVRDRVEAGRVSSLPSLCNRHAAARGSPHLPGQACHLGALPALPLLCCQASPARRRPQRRVSAPRPVLGLQLLVFIPDRQPAQVPGREGRQGNQGREERVEKCEGAQGAALEAGGLRRHARQSSSRVAPSGRSLLALQMVPPPRLVVCGLDEHAADLGQGAWGVAVGVLRDGALPCARSKRSRRKGVPSEPAGACQFKQSYRLL